MKTWIRSHIVWMIILAVLSIPALLPLFHRGFFVSDDGEWMVIRLSAFYDSLRDGQFPVRFIGRLNHEYGYPVSNFLYPGFLYAGSVIHLLGFNFINTIKILFGFSLLFSSVFSYVWLSNRFKKIYAMLGAIIYLYAPYHLFDIYNRGSLGEILGLAIVPLFLYAADKKSVSLCSVLYAFLMLSHNTLALLFTPVLVLYAFHNDKKLIFSFLIGIGLAAFFIFPALGEQQYTVFQTVQISEWNNYFLSNISLIGILALSVLTASIFLYKKKTYFAALFIFTSLVSIFLSSSLSTPLWQVFPFMGKLVQFPWRFLSISIIGLSFLVPFVLTHMPKKYVYISISIIILASIYDGFPFLQKVSFTDKGEDYYRTNDASTTTHDEYMPRWVQLPPKNRPEKLIEENTSVITINEKKSNKVKLTTDSSKASTIVFNIIYYPGWEALVDQLSTSISYTDSMGRIAILVPAGKHDVLLQFKETVFRKIANVITVISIIFTLYLFIKEYEKIYRHK